MEAEEVRIPLDYLILTHELLSRSYEKIKEVLGESQAMMFFSIASDIEGVPPTMGKWNLEQLKTAMGAYGYSLKEERKGDKIHFRLYCPHAAKIHPYLGEGASFCPMSQMVLGSIRNEWKKAVVTQSRLEKDGSAFTLKLQE
jgi:hypothetical protein